MRAWRPASDFGSCGRSLRAIAGTLGTVRGRCRRSWWTPAREAGYLPGLTGAGLRVVVIDDLADRELPVDLVVNPSAGAGRLRYRGAPRTRFLLGSSYALLRPAFSQAGARSVPGRARRVLVTVGGGDPDDLTSRLVGWAAQALGAVEQDVVVGPFTTRSPALRVAVDAAGGRVAIHEDPKDVASLMLSAGVSLCGGGQTTYELRRPGRRRSRSASPTTRR